MQLVIQGMHQMDCPSEGPLVCVQCELYIPIPIRCLDCEYTDIRCLACTFARHDCVDRWFHRTQVDMIVLYSICATFNIVSVALLWSTVVTEIVGESGARYSPVFYAAFVLGECPEDSTNCLSCR